MSLINDTSEVIRFLEFAGKRSLINENAMHCRMTACRHIFSVLNDGEQSVEYVLRNLDEVVKRFREANDKVRASTLKVYKSRVKSSLEDFREWSTNPKTWEKAQLNPPPKPSKKEKSKPRLVVERTKPTQATKKRLHPNFEKETIKASSSGRVLRLPLRPDYEVEIRLPEGDLKLSDLMRLGLFLYPYCQDVKENEERPSLLI